VAPSLNWAFGNFRILRDGALSDSTKFDDAPAGYWDEAGRRELTEGWVFERCMAAGTFVWQPIFPSAMAFSKELAMRVGGFDVALADRRAEDHEFTLRLIYTARPGTLVAIRKHAENYSSDQLANLIDEVWVLDFIKQNHAESRPYHDIIDRGIVRRSLEASNAAFAARNHQLMRHMMARVPWRERPLKLHLKHAVASLPTGVAPRANALLQRIAESRCFFDWYNQDHHHAGLGLMMPGQVHYGQVDAVHAARQQTLDRAFRANPERFAEDIDDHVKVEVGPFGRPHQLGDIPAPDLVGAFGEQFRLLVDRMTQLAAAFSGFGVLLEDPIHGADRAVAGALVEQAGVDFRRSQSLPRRRPGSTKGGSRNRSRTATRCSQVRARCGFGRRRAVAHGRLPRAR
jgi:hypothetical protein